MQTLIDGYNLIFAIGFISDRESPERFERARRRLLRVLASRLTADQRRETLIIFDAANAPAGLPDAFEEEQISVRFAVGYPEADDLIEVLIRQHSAAKKLVVVSSDHRIQRAAAARKAKHIDSQDWFDRLQPPPLSSEPSPAPVKSNDPALLSDEEVAQWMSDLESPEPSPLRKKHSSEPAPDSTIESPFPPGFTDDLFDDDDL